jgi:hypothetical protein
MEEKDETAYNKWKESKGQNLIDPDRSDFANSDDDALESGAKPKQLEPQEDVLLNGEVRKKNDAAFECIGLIDELNANIGCALFFVFPIAGRHLYLRLALQLIRASREEDLTDSLEFVQCRLMGMRVSFF